MVSKALAALLAAAVLSVGGYTYWQYADRGCCTATQPQTALVTTTVEEPVSLPCCQEPSRASGLSVSAEKECCGDDVAAAPSAPEVVSIMPHEVK